MDISLFGFKFIRDSQPESIQSFVRPTVADDVGVASIVDDNAWGFNSLTNSDIKPTDQSENALITQYREIARNPEVDKAIEEIISEFIISDEKTDSVKIDLTYVDLSEPIKVKIRESFKRVLKLLNFKTKGYDIVKKWYIDGRLNFHIIVDEEKLDKGIVELRYIDSKKIKKIRKLIKGKTKNTAKYVEWYEFNEKGVDNIDGSYTQGIKISPDAIAHANSGELNPQGTIILSLLDKAIAPANKLRSLEHATVIARLVRAPERRLIYVDVGNLPKSRAEQYMQGVIGKYKTKITYDMVTGKIKDDRNIMALTEDYFIPRMNGSKSTEFDTLKSTATNAGVTDELEYFKKQLYEALNVPLSRTDSNSTFNIGRSNEISREEARFAKFIQRLRTKFNELFDSLLSRELVLKRVMSIEEFEEIKSDIHYDYLKDNYFTELMEADALANRVGVLSQVEPYIGRFFSDEYVKKNILKQTDDEINNIAEQIKKEKEANPDIHTPSDTLGQVDLQGRLSSIEVDKHAQQAEIDSQYDSGDNIKPNPFKE